MSDGTYATGSGEPYRPSNGESGTVDTAKEAAADLKDTATDAARDVAGTAKDEAASVAHETKAQAADLLQQTRRELSDQAATQQERVAAGLSAIGDELGAMARGSEGSGVAADLVQRVSDKASSAASWLSDRDPAGVLDDVKAFARRRPAVFIAAALIAGVVAGRLTRALIANAQDDSDEPVSGTGERAAVTATPIDEAEFAPAGTAAAGAAAYADDAPLASDAVPPASGAAPLYTADAPQAADEAPLYTESAANFDVSGEEASHDRPDTV